MSDERVLVVLPAFREEASVGAVVAEVRSAGLACVVVDDGSPDGTGEAARAAGAVVVRLPVNLGVGGALRCGFRYAEQHGYDAVVQCDADGQHPAGAITELIRAAQAHDAHLVIGSRFADGSGDFALSRSRRIVMQFLSWLVAVTGRVRVRDTSSGFRCIRQPLLREFARSYPAQYLGDTVEALVAAGRAGYRVLEVPVDLLPRAGGEPSAPRARAVLLTARVAITVAFGLGLRLPQYAPEPRSATAPDAAPDDTPDDAPDDAPATAPEPR